MHELGNRVIRGRTQVSGGEARATGARAGI